MEKYELHKAQAAVLYGLRHSEPARFSELMRLTDLTSDDFKFHLRRLMTLGYVAKTQDGHYGLTLKDKEFANNLDSTRRTVQKQPKLSVLLVVPKPMKSTEASQKYLFQQRKRKPYFDFWSCISGPAQRDEELEATAARELIKQTGLTADFTVRSFYRKRDYDRGSNVLFEDKLFAVLEATNIQGILSNGWHGGVNQWMTVEELRSQDNYFASSCEVTELRVPDALYTSRKVRYAYKDY